MCKQHLASAAPHGIQDSRKLNREVMQPCACRWRFEQKKCNPACLRSFLGGTARAALHLLLSRIVWLAHQWQHGCPCLCFMALTFPEPPQAWALAMSSWPCVQAHVGGDPVFSDNLFKFGDKDGQGTGALLQHPLAVAALQDGRVLVADSYNHRLKASATIRSVKRWR